MILFDPRFRPWLERKLDTVISPDAVFLGQLTHGEITAAVAFSYYTGHDIHVSLAVDKGKGSRQLMRHVFWYVFGEKGCNCQRMTALIRSDNPRSIQLAQRFGFQQEGTLRRYYGEGDALIFGLLKSEIPHVVTRQASQGS